jgi:hypothetical protein
VRSPTATAWQPAYKPVRLLELGFPAVDRGANRPSAFPDPKSSESVLPPFSTGARDDAIQRLALEAALDWWQPERGNNPVSPVTGQPMVDVSRTHLWCWDARPYPQFPARRDLWADADCAAIGHWLAGRAGAVSLGAVIADLTRLAGVGDVDVSRVEGTLEGHMLDGSTSVRGALSGLVEAFGLAVSRTAEGGLRFATVPRSPQSQQLAAGGMVQAGSSPVLNCERSAQSRPARLHLSTWSSERSLQPVTATRATGGSGPDASIALPIVADTGLASGLLDRLMDSGLTGPTISCKLAPLSALEVEVGDPVVLEGEDGVWLVQAVEGGMVPEATLVPWPAPGLAPMTGFAPGEVATPLLPSTPLVMLLDLPAPWATHTATGPLLAVAAEPWTGAVDVLAGGSPVASVQRRALIGTLTAPVAPGPAGRTLHSTMSVELWFGALDPGPGVFAALDDAGTVLDVIAWSSTQLLGPGQWRLSGLVRGLGGRAEPPDLPAGTRIVVLDAALGAASLPAGARGSLLEWTATCRSGTGVDDTTTFEAIWDGLGALPWSPVHVRARRTAGGIRIDWIARSRGDGDALEPPSVPPAAATEAWTIAILPSTAPGPAVRTLAAATCACLYPQADEAADFGTPQTIVHVAISQRADDGRDGHPFRGSVLVA